MCENQHKFESMTWELFDQSTWNTSRKYQLESLRPLTSFHVSMSLSLAPPVPLQGGCLLQVYLHSCCLCTATEIPNLKSTRRCEDAHVRFRIMLVYCCIGGSIGEYNFFAGRLLQSSHPTKSHSWDGQICMANSLTTWEPVLIFIEFLSVLSVRHGNATGQSSLCILCGG